MRVALVMVSVPRNRIQITIRTIFSGNLKSSHDDICGRWCPRWVILSFKVLCCKLLEYCNSNLLVCNSPRDCLESCNLWWSEACLYAVLLHGLGMPLTLYFCKVYLYSMLCPLGSVYANSAASLSPLTCWVRLFLYHVHCWLYLSFLFISCRWLSKMDSWYFSMASCYT